ncbi:hypothetical protein NpPPO83_00012310 [Neofusicoccum parvum]|uniref:Uncharacterized protein n=1 Tax=Neofusicoccum parvum TaxID=310453 RepID=A0ACB5RND5_9PEZI|nr:hypothetical protein NpPPO83_00012310 [Neofusicoccum parvum]
MEASFRPRVWYNKSALPSNTRFDATILAVLMAVTPLASAQFAFVNGIAVPKNLGAGQNFSISISSEDTSQ